MPAAASAVLTDWLRRASAVFLGVVFVVFALETAVHSAHHVDPADATACPVAVAAAQVAGTVLHPPVIEAPAPDGRVRATVASDTVPDVHPRRPAPARAPPSASA